MTHTTTASPRERWRVFFLEILAGQDDLAQLAADTAIRALRTGATQEVAVEAGMRAARAAVDPSGEAPHTQRSAPHPQPAPPRPQSSAPSAHGGWPPGSGVAVFVDRRTESLDGQFFQVLSCRLRELSGGRLVGPMIPVEVRGRSIIGQLVKDDVVLIPDGQPGETRIVKTLRNLTTNSSIEAKGRPFRRWRTLRRTVNLLGAIAGSLVALAILAAVVWVASMLLSGSGTPFG